jgi:hypothetical protein
MTMNPDSSLTPVRVTFVNERCRVLTGEGEESELPIPEPDRELALVWIKRLNRMSSAEGKRLSTIVSVDGFEPWWFVQDYIYSRLLLPYTRYRRIVTWALKGVEIVDPPPDLVYLLEIVERLDGAPRLRLRRRRDVFQPLRRVPVAMLTLFMSSLSWKAALWFRLRKRPVLLYALDVVSAGSRHDFRLAPVYQELKERGLAYGEFLHSLGDAKTFANLCRRRRFVVDMRAATVAWSLFSHVARPNVELRFDGESLTAEEQLVYRAIARAALHAGLQSARRYRCLRFLVQLHGPKLALVLDDSRHSHELVAACRSLGVTVLSYQHGLAFNKYFVGLMCYGFGNARRHTSDAYGLWSEYFRRRLLRHSELYDESTTFICGMLRAPAQAAAPRRSARKGDQIHVQVVSETMTPAREVAPYVARLVADPRFSVILKLRPGERRSDEWKSLGTQLDFTHEGVYESMASSDIVLGTYSSVLYEAALVLKPILVVRTPSPFGAELGEEGLAELASSPEEVVGAALRAASLPMDELERRRDLLWGMGRGDGARHLLDHALKVVS